MKEGRIVSYEAFASAVPSAAAGSPSGCSELVRAAMSYLERHARENVTVDAAAEVCHVSPAHLMRQFKKETGCSVHAWLIGYRMERACDLIRQGRPITAACEELGYTDYPLFYRNFCKTTGVSPRAYQKECREKPLQGEHRVLQYPGWHWSGNEGTEQA